MRTDILSTCEMGIETSEEEGQREGEVGHSRLNTRLVGLRRVKRAPEEETAVIVAVISIESRSSHATRPILKLESLNQSVSQESGT